MPHLILQTSDTMKIVVGAKDICTYFALLSKFKAISASVKRRKDKWRRRENKKAGERSTR